MCSKRIVAVVLLLILVSQNSNELFGQCPTGYVLFKSQAEVDQFKIDYPNCAKIEESLGLCFPIYEVINLDGLSNIDTIMGSLYTSEDCKLKSLVGLENLKYIGENLSLREGRGPENLQGLNGLERIEGSVRFDEISSVQSLEGLDNLKSIGGDIDLDDNYGLLNLDGMDQLTSVGGDVNIEANEMLKSVDGLVQLTSIGGDLNIESNDSLISINGFSSLKSIGGLLEIRKNANLVNIENFGDDQVTVGDVLRIIANPELVDLSGLESLVSINGLLNIKENHKLESLVGLENIDPNSISELLITDSNSLSYCSVKSICDYLQLDMASFFFELNATGCNSGVEVATICADPTSTEELVANNKIQIFPNPSSTQVNIQCLDSALYGNYFLTTVQGQFVKVIPCQSMNTILDLGGLPNGIYLLTSSANSSAKIYHKIIKH